MNQMIVFSDGSFDSTSDIHGIGFVVAERNSEVQPKIAKGFPVSVAVESTVFEIELTAMMEAIRFVSTLVTTEQHIVFLTDNKFVVSRFKDPHGKTSINPMLCFQFAKLVEDYPWVHIDFYKESEVLSEAESALLRNIADSCAVKSRKTKQPIEIEGFPTPNIMKGD